CGNGDKWYQPRFETKEQSVQLLSGVNSDLTASSVVSGGKFRLSWNPSLEMALLTRERKERGQRSAIVVLGSATDVPHSQKPTIDIRGMNVSHEPGKGFSRFMQPRLHVQRVAARLFLSTKVFHELLDQIRN